MKRILSIVVAAFMLLALLAGCSSSKKSLVVWNIWPNPDDTNSKAFANVLEAYKKDHPNVSIEVVSTENEAYKTKLRTAASAKELPDVFFSWGAGVVSPHVSAGLVEPLDSYLDSAYKANILGGTLDNFTFNGKVYGLTMYQWASALYCNKEMFDAQGVKVPETYDELVTAINAFKGAGIVPIGVGAKDGWPAMFFQNIMAVRTAGSAKCNEILSGASSMDCPEIVKSAQYVLDLVALGAFDPGCLAMSYDEAKMTFLNGQVPMFYIGDWFVSEIQDPSLSLVKDKVVAVNFPATNDGKDSSQILGGAIDGFCVSSASKNKSEAAEFVKYLTENMSRESFAIGGSSPTRKFDMSSYTIDPLGKQILDYSSLSTGAVLAWDTFLEGEAAEKHKSLCQQLFAAEITAEDFAAEMAKLQ